MADEVDRTPDAPDVSSVAARNLQTQPIRVLVDTNVVLDLLLRRDPWLTDAKRFWDARDAGQVFVYILASIVTDVYYVCRKQVGKERALAAVQACLTGFEIVPVNQVLLQQALGLTGPDFEDNVQIACAQKAALDFK
jgi:predicted nucleic acid-binding protein